MNATRPPRPKTTTWEVGDVLMVGRVRWAIRTITGTAVELESMSEPNASTWWTTDLANLPEKDA